MAYSVVVYALDVSPSMVALTADPTGNGKRPRIDLAKEYIARLCEPKIQSGRKTEHVGLVSFGGRTNNQANRSWISDHPDDDEPPYMAVSSDVAIQTAKPKVLEQLMNLEVGRNEGNPISALMVALDMIEQHKHTKRWSLEIKLVTDGESSFVQEEYEEAMKRLDQLGVKLTVLGIDFQDPHLPIAKDKSKTKRLSEKFWRKFIETLHEELAQATESEIFLPLLLVFTPELEKARRPQPGVTDSTVYKIHLYIGAAGIDEEQAIVIPMQWSKATMKARPPSLSKAWKTAVDMQQLKEGTQASQLMSQLAEQSQSRGDLPAASDLAALMSAKVNRHSSYFIKHKPAAASASTSQMSATQRSDVDEDFIMPSQVGTLPQVPEEEEEAEEEVVEKEDLVKAWRFGSSWIPMEIDTFDPLVTQQGVEVLGFIPQENIRKYMLMGEVRYLWPDSSPRAQIMFSSFVAALFTTGLVAITRFVYKDNAEPHIGVAIPDMKFPGDDKRLDWMYWIKLPYADDDHKFWFPSLTKYKSTTGKEITEHPYIPTQEQCDLMDELVQGMDLDTVKPPGYTPPEKEEDDESSDDDDMDEEDEPKEEEDPGPRTWFDSTLSYNPVIHRTKEAILHASMTNDTEANPLGPPHPAITQYFNTPPEIVERVEKVTEQLKDALNIKKVPPRMPRNRTNKEGLREDEGFLDIDELFDTPGGDVQPKTETASPVKAKDEKPDVKFKVEDDDPDFIMPPPKAKPKPGRLVSNERPLEDFNRLVQGEGDMFRKAIQDLGAVVKENVAASFSRSAFPLAIECLAAMRSTALTFEEVETYNAAVDDLEKTVKAPGFKHPDFWDHFTNAGAKVAKISDDEAAEALEEEDYD